jgi:uncharacterized protein YndB with AHSA1/START domain
MGTMPPALGDPGSRAASPAAPEEPGRRAVVTPLRRPPVWQSVLVRAPQRRTFDTFVRTIGAWWPVQPFSAGKDQVRTVTVERRTGGRVYESWADGTEVAWGELLAWEPPERFVMTWTLTPAPTEVELTFAAVGPRLTRVCVAHRGWEALTDEQLGEDCALPGGYAGGSYATGWALILGRLGAVLGLAEAESETEGGQA